MYPRLADLTVSQLKQAITLREKIEALEAELAFVLGASPGTRRGAVAQRRRVPAAARASSSAGQRAMLRPAAAVKTRRKPRISADGRKRIAEAVKARWARAKAAGKNGL